MLLINMINKSCSKQSIMSRLLILLYISSLAFSKDTGLGLDESFEYEVDVEAPKLKSTFVKPDPIPPFEERHKLSLPDKSVPKMTMSGRSKAQSARISFPYCYEEADCRDMGQLCLQVPGFYYGQCVDYWDLSRQCNFNSDCMNSDYLCAHHPIHGVKFCKRDLGDWKGIWEGKSGKRAQSEVEKDKNQCKFGPGPNGGCLDDIYSPLLENSRPQEALHDEPKTMMKECFETGALCKSDNDCKGGGVCGKKDFTFMYPRCTCDDSLPINPVPPLFPPKPEEPCRDSFDPCDTNSDCRPDEYCQMVIRFDMEPMFGKTYCKCKPQSGPEPLPTSPPYTPPLPPKQHRACRDSLDNCISDSMCRSDEFCQENHCMCKPHSILQGSNETKYQGPDAWNILHCLKDEAPGQFCTSDKYCKHAGSYCNREKKVCECEYRPNLGKCDEEYHQLKKERVSDYLVGNPMVRIVDDCMIFELHQMGKWDPEQPCHSAMLEAYYKCTHPMENWYNDYVDLKRHLEITFKGPVID